MNWHVYGVIDPLHGNGVVYIGMSRDPKKRMKYHARDKNSAIYDYLSSLKEVGVEPIICIFGVFSSREVAADFEEQLISLMPLIFNRTHQEGSERYWSKWRHIERAAALGSVA